MTATVLTPLSNADRGAYLAPYPTAGSRLPLLQWPRAMSLEGSPAPEDQPEAIANAIADWSLARFGPMQPAAPRG